MVFKRKKMAEFRHVLIQVCTKQTKISTLVAPFQNKSAIFVSESFRKFPKISAEFPVNLFCPILLFLARARLGTINNSQFD